MTLAFLTFSAITDTLAPLIFRKLFCQAALIRMVSMLIIRLLEGGEGGRGRRVNEIEQKMH